MKTLLIITTILLMMSSCESKSGHRLDGTRKRVVRPVWGINNNVKLIRNIDTMYAVGDTVRVDGIEGLSSVPEVVIVK